MLKKYFVFLMVCCCFSPSFGRGSPCMIEIVNLSTSNGTVLFDDHKVIQNEPICDEIADEKYGKSIAIGKRSLQITANIDLATNGLYPEIKCLDRDISWTLISDGRGLFSLYIADDIDKINGVLKNIKNAVESDGMFYTDVVVQSSSDSEEELN